MSKPKHHIVTLNIRLAESSEVPVYRQIVEQVRQLIATGQLRPGDRLPSVRNLAETLGLSPGTVLKAYMELEEDRITQSRKGAGTVVAAARDDPRLVTLRQRHLSSILGNAILETLSLNYSLEEIEAAFQLDLARWREERQDHGLSTGPRGRKRAVGRGLTIVASDDWALSQLVSQLKQRDPNANIELKYAGSLGGLIALQEGRADLAGIHLLDEETGEYNYPYIRHLLPNRRVAVLHLAYRIQGLMLAKGNPKGIEGIQDLKRPDVSFINRQNGSGTRILLDFQLRQQGIAPSQIEGYEKEVGTHLAVARAIAKGNVDSGLGIEAAARACDIDFLPLFKERYDLVIPQENLSSKLVRSLMEIAKRDNFRSVVGEAGGYDTTETGSIRYFG